MTKVAAISLQDADALQPRAVGAASLAVHADDTGRTRLQTMRQSGSTRLVLPQTFRPDLEAVIVNTAGGITGGDAYDFAFTAGPNATLTLTTQAAERAYRAQTGETGRLNTRLNVNAGARLNWLPQEMILFDGCTLHRRLDIQLDASAELLMVEPVVFGRTAMGETLRDVHFKDRIKITRNGVPIYIDGADLHGNAAAHLATTATAKGSGAMCSVVMVTPDAKRHLTGVRALLPETAGASVLGSDVLVIRHLAPDSYDLRRDLIPVLEHLNQSPLPASWRL
ncbi:urease accessory protein UreD [Octadecabacter sp. 1_MG-2023]|nr:urease accessory protein UreD [Octadecabacter sp. 1_MG-2023]MDO6733512.1 urease accessory protein UreD [Octadecabacter sp. 1_MG-2023]